MEAPTNMLVAMTITALLCLIIGVFPNLLYALLPYPVDFEPYSGAHVTGSLSFLLFTALGFFLVLKHLNPENTISLDTDWFYRKGARVFSWFAHNPLARYESVVSELANTLVLRSLYACAALGLWFDLHIVDGVVNSLARFSLFCAEKMRHLQSGVLGHYALGMIVGILLCVAIYVVVSHTAALYSTFYTSFFITGGY
jgi:multicomponent Na+:H+ antiporter subunit D